jgi:hypothetical protein
MAVQVHTQHCVQRHVLDLAFVDIEQKLIVAVGMAVLDAIAGFNPSSHTVKVTLDRVVARRRGPQNAPRTKAILDALKSGLEKTLVALRPSDIRPT